MNLSTIENTPFVQGVIHVKSSVDPLTGEIKTFDEFEVLDRFHEKTPERVLMNQPPLFAKHPIHDRLLKSGAKSDGIQSIPIRLFFDKTDAALQIGYRAYCKDSGKPLCSGNGKDAMRLVLAADGTETLSEQACPGSDTCPFANKGSVNCYRQVKMAVQIDGQEDELSIFEVRSTSINTYRALRAQLGLIERRLKGLRHVPLVLKLWKRSNALSNFEGFHCMRVEYAGGEVEAFNEADKARKALAELGIDDDNDTVFAHGSALEDHFFTDDTYAQVMNLGESAGKRRGAVSFMDLALMKHAKSAEETVHAEPDAAPINVDAGDDFDGLNALTSGAFIEGAFRSSQPL